MLSKYHGEKFPGEVIYDNVAEASSKVFGSPWSFVKSGKCGMELSELLPGLQKVADEITLIRSMKSGVSNHLQGMLAMQTGKGTAGRPTVGSWVAYALGSETQNLPAYVVLSDPGGLPVDGERNWSSGFLPALYQGTAFQPGPSPVFHLKTPSHLSVTARSNQLDLLSRLNRDHASRFPDNTELAARIANLETAARMQGAVPEAVDLSSESAATRKLYGLDNPVTAEYGRRCLLARRLVERGVRYVQLFLSGQPWDTHDKNAERLKGLCAATDQPSAALVQDLKARGLLDSTVVLWTGEFGRLPISQGTDGRDHNRHAFSLWVAGGGFKAGHVHGATDDFGYKAVQDVATIYDLHATILHLIGLDHTRLSFYNNGIERRLTDVHGHVIQPVLA
jgi:hypothetical protein